MENIKLENEQLEEVSGGYRDEIQDYVDLFNKYGFKKEARTLSRTVSPCFEAELRNTLKRMGFAGELSINVDYDRPNWNFYNGNRVSKDEALEVLENFLMSQL